MGDNLSRRKPILVTGSHRSGSTWVGEMLALSPLTTYISEPFNLDHRGTFRYISNQNELDKWKFRFKHNGLAAELDFYHYIQDIIKYSYFSYYYIYSATRDIRGTKSLNYPIEYLKRVVRKSKTLSTYRAANIRPLLKDPIAVFSAEWLANRFDMDVVVLIRHPAAFVSSLKRLNWTYNFSWFLEQPLLIKDYLYPFKSELKEYAEREKDIIDQGILLWKIIHYVIDKYRKQHPDWLFFRHEDLSRQPERIFATLFHNLDLEYSEKISRAIQSYSSTENQREAPKDTAHFLKRDSNANIWNWKTRLSPAEIDRIRTGVEEISRAFYSEQDW